MAEIEAARCAFCDFHSDYVLTVDDPAPDELAVIDKTVAMPICREHYEMIVEADIADESDGGKR